MFIGTILHWARLWLALQRGRLVALLFGAFLGTTGIAATTDKVPRMTSHIVDGALVMGASGDDLERKLLHFQETTTHQLFVLTVPTTGALSIDEFAVLAFENTRMGRSKQDDGVLLVVSTGERTVRIEVGYGLEGVLTDARSSRIIHDVIAPQFAQGKFAEGIDAGVAAITAVIAPTYKFEATTGTSGVSVNTEDVHIGGWAIAAICTVVFLPLLVASVGLGIFGAPIISITVLIAMVLLPGGTGQVVAAAIAAATLLSRYALISRNVRRYQLPKSNNHTLTWVRCFLTPGIGKPRKKGDRSLINFEFSWTSETGNSDKDDRADGIGEGGRSGGGGASGHW